jgi:hypothetical protein
MVSDERKHVPLRITLPIRSRGPLQSLHCGRCCWPHTHPLEFPFDFTKQAKWKEKKLIWLDSSCEGYLHFLGRHFLLDQNLVSLLHYPPKKQTTLPHRHHHKLFTINSSSYWHILLLLLLCFKQLNCIRVLYFCVACATWRSECPSS